MSEPSCVVFDHAPAHETLWAAGATQRQRRPKARAAGASNRNGSKWASACWTCAWRAARSSSLDASSGPADNSACVTAVIMGTFEQLEPFTNAIDLFAPQ